MSLKTLLDRLKEVADQADRCKGSIGGLGNAANDLTKVPRPFDGWVKDTTDFGEGATNAGIKMVGAAKVITAEILRVSDEMRKSITATYEAVEKLSKANQEAANRTADVIGFLEKAAKSGMNDLNTWMQQWSMYHDQIVKLLALNPGSKMAADWRLMIAALEELRDKVLGGQIRPDEKLNLG